MPNAVSQNFDTWPEHLGIAPSSTVVLMADLTRITWKAARNGDMFDPDRFIQVFLDALGPSGTLLIPTFDHHLEHGDAFDVLHTRPTTGALAVAALARDDVRRTRHPLHSFAVFGKDAEQLEALENTSSFAVDSPFGHMHRNNARLVAIDLSLNDAFTYAHHVEELELVPYRQWKDMDIRYTDPQGRTTTRPFRLFAKRPGHHVAFHALEKRLEAERALVHSTLDGSTCISVDLEKAHVVVAQDIRENNAAGFHSFEAKLWIKDMLRPVLRDHLGFRTPQERIAHAARVR